MENKTNKKNKMPPTTKGKEEGKQQIKGKLEMAQPEHTNKQKHERTHNRRTKTKKENHIRATRDARNTHKMNTAQLINETYIEYRVDGAKYVNTEHHIKYNLHKTTKTWQNK